MSPRPERCLTALVALATVVAAGARAPAARAADGLSDSLLAAIIELEYARSADIDDFAPFLADSTAAVRARTLLAIARAAPAGAEARVAEFLRDEKGGVRQMAAFALGQLAAPAQLGALVGATEDTDPLVVAAAAGALARIGGTEVADRLTSLLGFEAAHVRRAAALGLARLADSTRVEPLLAALAAENDPGATAAMIEALEKTPRLLPASALVPLLGSSSPVVRAAAARALGKTGDGATGRTPLVAALDDREWRVRTSAARALGELRAGQAAPALIARLKDPQSHVREAAAAALGEIGHAGAAEPLVRASADASPGVRRAAVTALGVVLGARAPATLSTRLEDPSPYVAAAALTALATAAGKEALPVVVARTDPGQHSAVRLAAVAALGHLGLPAAASPLRALVSDEDWAVAAIAADVLAELGDRGAEEALMTAAAREAGFEETAARVAAIAALGRVGGARALGTLRRALADPDPRVRAAAVASADSLAARGVDLDQKLRSAVKNEEKQLAADGGQNPPTGPVPDALAPPSPPAEHRARLITPHGTIEIELLSTMAPLAVANFVLLARSGFYDRGVFHRVVPNFVVQGGCPRHDGYGGPGYALRNEASPEEYGVGTVGMADAGLDTAGSQFFLTHSPVPRLEGRYTAFGRVTSGIAVLDQIQLGDSFRVEVLPADAAGN